MTLMGCIHLHKLVALPPLPPQCNHLFLVMPPFVPICAAYFCRLLFLSTIVLFFLSLHQRTNEKVKSEGK